MPVLGVLLHIIALPFPWPVRRLILKGFFGYDIHRSAYISRFSLVVPRRLKLGPQAKIGAFTVCKGMDLLELGEKSILGSLNWVFAFPLGTETRHFELDSDRKPQLIIGRHAAVTSRHIIDCTDEVIIGAFSTFAGFRSQILTHSIDLSESRQRCRPVRIGEYCFIGSGCILLGGSSLPDRSVLGAHSLLNRELQTPGFLYGGVPAKPIKEIGEEAKYFSRKAGYVL